MKLNKVSYKRVEEELGRGFDILNNNALDEKCSKMTATTFMKKDVKAWDRLSPRAEQPTGAGQSDCANNANFELASTNFQTRSRRLNTNKAAQAPDAPSQKSASSAKKSASVQPSQHLSQHSVNQREDSSKKAEVPSSHHSLSNHSAIKPTVPSSHASAKPPVPSSHHS